jgi:hypothetical protein
LRLRLVSSIAGLACLAATAGALAGKQVTSGDHQLKFTVTAAPAKPKKITTLHLVTVGGTVSGQRSTDPTAGIVISLPGFKVKPGSIPICKLSVMVTSHGTGCSAASKIGGGTATADARPAIPAPVTATITAYYGVDDLDANGKPAPPKPAVLAHASALGVTTEYAFDITPGTKLTLPKAAPPPPGMTSLFELTGFDVKINKVIQTPAKCKGSWPVSETYEYQNGGTLTATDKVACKKK